MDIKNFEFKARVEELESYENKLLALNPDFRGTDRQTDTYFRVPKGRLKLREGNIENSLIYYEREDVSEARKSDIILYRHEPNESLKKILTLQLGVKVVVEKIRKIYFINNVKFHFDQVPGLGQFIEVEAIDDAGNLSLDSLEKQCNYYFEYLGLQSKWIVKESYSDLLKF